jgi:hypothetical protein
MIGREERSTRRKICINAFFFVHNKSQMTWPGLQSGQWEAGD